MTNQRGTRMGWFKTHLNWSYLFGWWIILAILFPLSNTSIDSTFFYLIVEALFLPLTIWVVHEKKRSQLWSFTAILPGLGWVILLLEKNDGFPHKKVKWYQFSFRF